MRARAAVVAGKLARSATRALGHGGTALPGLVASRVDPTVVPDLAAQLEASVLVTGTNGKTTTSRMLAEILAADGRAVVHNRAGSNLMRGIAAALVESADALGRLGAGSVAVFETDEATLPAAAAATSPRALVVTNLMRDQLDRYGEIEAVRDRWVAAIREMDRSTALVLNADDPSVATLAEHARGPVVLFGIDDGSAALPPAAEAEHAADALWDAVSGADFLYDRRFYAHLGHWRSAGNGPRRPQPDVSAVAVDASAAGRVSFDVICGGESAERQHVDLPLAGLYNVSNALAAIAASRVLETPGEVATAALGRVSAVFGRQETLVVDGHPVRILLGKNPAGMNEALRTLTRGRAAGDPGLHILVLLNDGLADGTDVSWIWDTDWEMLGPHVTASWVGGARASDMALRLSYAGLPAPPSGEHDVGRALDAALAGLPPGAPLVVLPTYTALLDVRERLGRRAGARRIWEGA